MPLSEKTDTPADPNWPRLGTVGLDGVIVQFADRLSDPANRAALAFRAALESGPVPGLTEVTTSLTSVLVRFDPLAVALEDLTAALRARLDGCDWMNVPLPAGRRLWRVPTIYGTDLAPQFREAAAEAGLSEAAALRSLSETVVRVQAIGFAPGQPYLGALPEAWDIPRQTGLTPRVREGALVVAIRQFVLFSVSAPTGWRQVGQTAFPLFRPDRDPPTLLSAGDEVQFVSVSRDAWDALRTDPMGGATCEALA